MNVLYKMKRPPSWWRDNWREALPIGNGLHGALVYGNIAHERVILTHTRLWREGKTCDMPDVSDILPEMRKLILGGRMPEADAMLSNALKERGYAPHEAYPFPGLDLNIYLPLKDSFSGYERGLHLDKAEAYVKYDCGGEKIDRRAFVSRADDVVVIECHRDSVISMSVHIPDNTDDQSIKLPENPVFKISEDGVWYYFKADVDGVEHGAVARVQKAGGKLLIVAKMFTEGSHETEWKRLREYISKLPKSYDTLLKKHVCLHKKLFERCSFELDCKQQRNLSNEELLDIAFDKKLPCALAERMWAFGRYLFICAADESGNPVNLTGLWSGEYRALWAFNMANINLEMVYWHALGGKLRELVLPFFDYFDSAMDDFRENAKKLYGCRGIFLPAVTMPGCTRHVWLDPHITNWTAGAGWIAQHYYDYYIYTGDEQFLRERVIPFMKEAALFYMDFVMWNKDKWHVCPSISPENHTEFYKGVETKLDNGTQSSIDAAMDIAVIRELFLNLTDAAKHLEGGENPGSSKSVISDSELAEYRKMLDGAPEYQVNESGAPREWQNDDYPDNPKHRHQSHLYPMFPGFELARKDEKTDETYRKGGIERMTIGMEYQTSWSLVQNAHLMARVKDSELAFESLNRVSKTCIMRNLFTTHNDWRSSGLTLEMNSAPFQIDANIGFVSAVQEMLLYSDSERVDLLPALPKAWKKGRIGPLMTRCGAEIVIEWTEKDYVATISAVRNTTFMLYRPDGSSLRYILREGEVVKAFGERKLTGER